MVVPRDVTLPLDVHSRVMCRFRSGDEFYMVKIIEKRDSADKPGDAKHVEYYVHYEAFNRRLDTWVSLLDFDLGTLEKPRAKETSDAQPNKDDGEKDPKKKKHKKDNDKNDVKVENDGIAAENRMKGHGGHGNAHPDPEHAEFDPRALQEHRVYKGPNILSTSLKSRNGHVVFFAFLRNITGRRSCTFVIHFGVFQEERAIVETSEEVQVTSARGRNLSKRKDFLL